MSEPFINKTSQQNVQKQFQQLTKAYRNIATEMNSLGTQNDTTLFRQKLQKDIKEASVLCKQTRQSLEELEANGMAPNQLNKLKEQFSKEVDKFQELTEQITLKEKEFKPQTVASYQQNMESSLLNQNQSYPNQQQQQQQQESQFIVHMENSDLERREEQTYQMLDDLQQLNDMFKDLHQIVHEQDEPLQQLSNNVQQVHDQVSSGVVHLEKAEEYQKSYRKTMCYILLALCIIGLIIGIVVWQKTK